MYESTFEGYMLFRMTEAEFFNSYELKETHYPEWVEDSPNPTYERYLWDADHHNKGK